MARVYFVLQLLAAVWFFGCTDGEEEAVEDPVTPEEELPPAIPDAPGADQEAEVVEDEPQTSEPNIEAATKAATRYVTAWFLNVRSGPGMQYEVVRTLKKGEKIVVLDEKRAWAKIAENEYVGLKFLSTLPPD